MSLHGPRLAPRLRRGLSFGLKISRELSTIKQVRGRIDQGRWPVGVGVCAPAEDKRPQQDGHHCQQRGIIRPEFSKN